MYNGVNYFRKKAPSKIFEKVPNTSVMRQKVESQQVSQENKALQIFPKTNIFYARARIRG